MLRGYSAGCKLIKKANDNRAPCLHNYNYVNTVRFIVYYETTASIKC